METVCVFIINPSPLVAIYDKAFINAISEIKDDVAIATFQGIHPLIPDADVHMSLGFGFITSIDQKIRILFFSKSGDQNLKVVLPTYIREKLSTKPILGYVILADSQYLMLSEEQEVKVIFPPRDIDAGKTLETRMIPIFEKNYFHPDKEGWLYVPITKKEIATFKEIMPDAPFVIAAVNHDTPNAMSLDKLREELELDDSVKILPCDPKNKADVKNVLLELLNCLESSTTIKQAITTISQA